MNMEIAFWAFCSTNTFALVGLAFRAGRLINKLETAEKRITDLEASKTEVALTRLGEQLAAVRADVTETRSEVRELMGFWQRLWSPGNAGGPAAAAGVALPIRGT